MAERESGLPSREVQLEAWLSSPCNIFCLEGSRLLNILSAWLLKCSENFQNALLEGEEGEREDGGIERTGLGSRCYLYQQMMLLIDNYS